MLATTPSLPHSEYLENLVYDRLSAKMSEANSGSSVVEEAMKMVRVKL